MPSLRDPDQTFVFPTAKNYYIQSRKEPLFEHDYRSSNKFQRVNLLMNTVTTYCISLKMVVAHKGNQTQLAPVS